MIGLIAMFLAAPTARELVLRYDQLMSPPTFAAVVEMTAHREDGSERGYRMKILKGGNDKARITFEEPAAARGQEMLRVGDNLWVYMPNLKRAVRLANRDSFMGGDFNNADVLRVNYAVDYEAELADTGDLKLYAVDLKAKSGNAPYDRIRLVFTAADLQPARAEYYAASGKLLRSAEFSEVRDYKGHKRPARIRMRNELATERWSALWFKEIDLSVKPPATRFVLDDLGK